jgi:hypothetical protein
VLESEGMPPKRYGVGDVVFFREGAHATWHIEDYVKSHSLNMMKDILIAIGFRTCGWKRICPDACEL